MHRFENMRDLTTPVLVTSRNLFLIESFFTKNKIPFLKKSSFSLITDKTNVPSVIEISKKMMFTVYLESERHMNYVVECSSCSSLSSDTYNYNQYRSEILSIPDAVAQKAKLIFKKLVSKISELKQEKPEPLYPYAYGTMYFSFSDGKNKYYYNVSLPDFLVENCPLEEVETKLLSFLNELISGIDQVSLYQSKTDLTGRTFYIIITDPSASMDNITQHSNFDNLSSSSANSTTPQSLPSITRRQIVIKRIPLNDNNDSMFLYPVESKDLLYQLVVPKHESIEEVVKKRLYKVLKYPNIRKIERQTSDTFHVYLS